MKRLITPILFVFILILCIGCQPNEEKANALIQKYLLENLYNYDSYSPIESDFKKAFHTALNDSVCRKHATNIVTIRNDIQEGTQIFALQMEEVGLFTKGQEMQGYYKGDLERYPEILETHQILDGMNKTLSDQILQLKINKPLDENKCIGYSLNHKFRYKDSAGNPATGNYYFLCDKDLKNILFTIDLDDETNKSMINVLNQFCYGDE